MSVINLIQRKTNQTAVYWGSPASNGRGKYLFAMPQEIMVRWEDEVENFAKDSRSRVQIGKDGKEFRANAIIYTAQIPIGGWDLDGYIYLGTLSDINNNSDPYTVAGAYEIKQINTVSELNNVDNKLFVIYV